MENRSRIPALFRFGFMIFCAIPLIIVFSICYAATRHEDMGLIFGHAARFGGWLAFFMVLVVGVMELFYRYIH